MKQVRSRSLQGAAVLIVLAAALTTGCSGSSAEPAASDAAGSDAAPEVSSTPKITTRVETPVPVEAYLLTDEQSAALGKAENTLRERCMQRFGIQFHEPTTELKGPKYVISQYRYGKLDPAVTAQYGFHVPGQHTASDLAKAKNAGTDSRSNLSTAQLGVLRGTTDPSVKSGPGGQDYNGQKVPAGGCYGEAKKKLGNYQDAPVAVDVNINSFQKSTEDKRVRAAFAKWSGCMKKEGFDYPTPIKADGDPKWAGTTVSAEEKQVATASATCMGKYNVAGIWNAVDVAYQKQAIEKNAQQLDDVKKDIEHDVKLAAQVTAE
ncbi:hypothetical protein ACIQM0_35025 [Streptomyces sp. NPDC091387]|uniref:hypothetical protein n=1 Tax=Streptomyces sp. NPDC091387 TaxID=3365998 RepID=UPI00381E0099